MDDLELIGMDYLWRVWSFKNNDNIFKISSDLPED